MIGRRTERRVHLFRPDHVMNAIFLYCLGVALQETGVSLAAVVLMSDHYHAIVTDREGRIPALMQRLNTLLTKATQAHRGWVGRVFDAQKPSYVELLTPDIVIEETAYVLTNPSAAGLVRFSKEWPGVRTRLSDIGTRVLRIERPDVFFAEDGVMPEVVEIPLEMPDMLVQVFGVEQSRRRIAEAIERHEAKAHAEAEAKGWAFKGADRIRKSSPYVRAKTIEERGRLNPRYAGGAEAIREAVRRDRAFRQRYAAARERWLAGERDVIWPAGTYAMKWLHNVPCAPS